VTVDRESEARVATKAGVGTIETGREPAVSPLAGVAVAVLAVSTSAILVELSDAPALVKALYRVGLTAAALAPVAVTRYRADLRRLGRRDAGVAIVAGVALAVHFAAWFASLDHTSVAASVTLVQAQPMFVAVGAWALLDERVTRRTVAGIVVAIGGMAAMTLLEPTGGTASAPRPTLGNGLALVAAVAAAAYFLAGRSIRRRVRLVPYVTVVYVACTGALLIGTVASGAPVVGYPPREWGLFAAMAIGPGLLGHTLLNWALAHLESSVVSVSLLGEPVGSTLLAVVVLNEVPTPVTVAGGVVVLAGIGLAATGRNRSAGEGDPTPRADRSPEEPPGDGRPPPDGVEDD
jgi:drug/metabolite transporter (DMT)-like permease